MGRDKASIELLGQTLLCRAVSCLREVAAQVAVIGDASPDCESEVAVHPDLNPGCGPLEGIRTGLSMSTEALALFLPCDCPLVPPRLFTLLKEAMGESLVSVPRDAKGQIHPLIGVYRRACLPLLRARLDRGGLSALGFLEELGPRARIPALSHLGIEDFRLLNINTPANLEEARHYLSRASSG